MSGRDAAGKAGRTVVSPLLVGAAALVAGVAVGAALLPSLGPRWLVLARRGLAGQVGAPGEPAALVNDAWAVVALTLGPPLLASLATALMVAVLQGLAAPRSFTRATAATGREPRHDLGRALALLVLTAAASVIAARREQVEIAASLGAPALRGLAALGGMAARIALRVGVVLLAAGLVDHALRRLRLRAALADESRQRRADDEADPRLRAEVRRRQQG